MTPGARVAAAIEVMDAISSGAAAEAALTRWARASRFAGSKDRAAVRDLVFDGLRNWRSDALRGGGTSGRLRMLGRLRAQSLDPTAFFSGIGHAPAPLTDAEAAGGQDPVEVGDRWNLPDWAVSMMIDSLGDAAERTALHLAERAPVTIRVNAARSTIDKVQAALVADDIVAEPNTTAPFALTVTQNARRLRNTAAFADGLFEFQDAASQAFVAGLPDAARVLDYCAGGGGKALALAARGMDVTAHDIDKKRMADLPERAARADATIPMIADLNAADVAKFDMIVIDAPCSGSGTWRRAPEAKWRTSETRVHDLADIQFNILSEAAEMAGKYCVIAYATCSVFRLENEAVVERFLQANPEWRCGVSQRWPVSALCDGFYTAHLTRQD